MKILGYLGVDQYGQHYHIKKHPRKELLEMLGASRASNMYCDTIDGKARHVGYIINGLWIGVYQVTGWKEQ